MSEGLEAFVKWCNSRGYKFNGLEIVRPPGDCGHGIFVKQNFRAEDVMIQIPETEMITAGAVADLPRYSKILAQADNLLTPMEILTMFFCLEEIGESPWTPYLRVLPKSFDTPSYQKRDFDPKTLPLSVRSYWENQKKEIHSITNKLIKLCPEVDSERILWAWHVVNTRCIFVENSEHEMVDNTDGDTIAVIPFVDMLNHQPTSFQGIAKHERVNGTYVVRATRTVVEGSELFVCYGPHENARLLIEYGFTLKNNPYGKVFIPHDVLFTLARIAGIQVTREHERIIQEINLPSHLYATDEGPSWALRNNIRVLLLDHEQMKDAKWKAIIYSHDPIEDEVDELIEDKLKIIIRELRDGIAAKTQKISDDVKWMWEEQVLICDTALKSFEQDE
ncbi:unnamed protein product [Caenorhabditis auriculariae]|uniref:SET domain-containing protein n=1 Tax=Caenorhabditis auriculariae TaxID=2777116 RepID=A0A8S1GMX7_9PELO|nr:unnamed protein product [Caenorhabditis auriculariae]